MHNITLAVRIAVLGYLVYLLVFLATAYEPASRNFHPPFVLFILDTLNLFVHEAGHLFFKPFGMFLHILGGSFFQCLIPLAMLIVTWRQNIGQIGYAGFWLGENLVNVSVYMKDAPYRKLHLISKGAIHDWGYLFAGHTEDALLPAELVCGTGLLLCGLSVGAGIYFAIKAYREPEAALQE